MQKERIEACALAVPPDVLCTYTHCVRHGTIRALIPQFILVYFQNWGLTNNKNSPSGKTKWQASTISLSISMFRIQGTICLPRFAPGFYILIVLENQECINVLFMCNVNICPRWYHFHKMTRGIQVNYRSKLTRSNAPCLSLLQEMKFDHELHENVCICTWAGNIIGLSFSWLLVYAALMYQWLNSLPISCLMEYLISIWCSFGMVKPWLAFFWWCTDWMYGDRSWWGHYGWLL